MIYKCERTVSSREMTRTGVLFDPGQGGGEDLTPEQIKAAVQPENAAVEKLGEGADGKVFRCRILNYDFAAKLVEDKDKAFKEFHMAVALVEPPFGEYNTIHGLLTAEQRKMADEWLRLRNMHPGFDAILHYRYYLDLEVGAIILMDVCDRTLVDCLRKDQTCFLSTDEQGELIADAQHPLVEAVKQVLQGVHYLAHVARVSHGDLHANNVMRKSTGHWCIIDFGRAKPAVAAAEDIVQAQLYDLFTRSIPRHLQVRGGGTIDFLAQDEPCFVRTHYKKWCIAKEDHSGLQRLFNGMFPYLGDIALLWKYRFIYQEEEEVRESKFVWQEMVKKAMADHPGWKQALPPKQASGAPKQASWRVPVLCGLYGATAASCYLWHASK